MASDEHLCSLDRARIIVREAVPKAAEALVACLNAEDVGLRLRAAMAILNRAGFTEAGQTNLRAAEIEVGGRLPSTTERMLEAMG